MHHPHVSVRGTSARPFRPSVTRLIAVLSLSLSLAVGVALGPLSRTAHADAAPAASVTKAVVDFDGNSTGGTVTVDKTTDLRDQVVHVSWTGLHPSLSGDYMYADDQPRVLDDAGEPLAPDGAYTAREPASSLRTVAVLQCWGANPNRDQCLTYASPNSVQGPQFWTNDPGDYVQWAVDHPGLDPNVYYVTGAAMWDGRETAADVAGYGLDPRATGRNQPTAFPFMTRSGKVYPNGNPPDISEGGNSSDNHRNGLTASDGTGSTDIELYTKESAPSLGCDAAHECSLVVVPLDLMTRTWGPDPEAQAYFDANPADMLTYGISSMRPSMYFTASNWARRIVFPLGFLDEGAACPLGGAQVQSAGNEQSAEAITSWQRPLCNGSVPVSLSHSVQSDSQAVASFARGATDMAVVHAASLDSATKRAPELAPIAASGIGFAWLDDQAPTGQTLKLTPRVMAKLLTESYSTHVDPNTPTAAGTLGQDPDYLRTNPPVVLPDGSTASPLLNVRADPVLVANGGDAIRELWDWVLADADAAAWVNGAPDPWGMTINATWRGYRGSDRFEHRDSWVCATSEICQQSSLGSPPGDLDAYYAEAVKTAMPHQLLAKTVGSSDTGTVRLIRGLQSGTSQFGSTSPFGVTPVTYGWITEPFRTVGLRMDMVFAASATSSRYRVQMAALQNAAGNFVQPDVTGLAHAVKAAVQDPKTGAWSVPVTVADPLAYPVTDISHAEVATTGMAPEVAAKVAAVLDHAAGPGQLLGPEAGALPQGYVPLPTVMQDQTEKIANDVRAQAGPLTLQTLTGTVPTPTPTSTPTLTSTPTPTSTPTLTNVTPVAKPAPTVSLNASQSRAALPESPPVVPVNHVPQATATPTVTPTVSRSPSPSPSTSAKAGPTPSSSPTKEPTAANNSDGSRKTVGHGSGGSGGGGGVVPPVVPPSSAAHIGASSASPEPASSTAPDLAPAGAVPVAQVQTVATQSEAAGPMKWALLTVLLLGFAAAAASQVLAFRSSRRSLPSLLRRAKTT